MGVIDLDARVKKLEQEAGGGAVIDQLEAAVTALEEQINGDGETDLGLAGDVETLETAVQDLDDARPTVFSATEKIVGEWVDDKPIYQTTFDLGAETYAKYDGWTTTTAQISGVDSIIFAVGTSPSKDTCTPLMATKTIGDYIQIQSPRNGTDSPVKYLTLQYTKTEAE